MEGEEEGEREEGLFVKRSPSTAPTDGYSPLTMADWNSIVITNMITMMKGIRVSLGPS